MEQQKKSRSKIGKYIYMVVDLDNDELPLCVGTLKEVADFCNTGVLNVTTAMINSKKKGYKCKYQKVKISKRERKEMNFEK